MNYRSKYLYDLLKISYLDKEEFERAIKEIYVNSHFENVDKLSDKAFCELVNNLHLNKREMKEEIRRIYKYSKDIHWILNKMCFVISDKRKVLYYGSWWSAFKRYVKYTVLLFFYEELDCADESVWFARGVEEAAIYLDTDPDTFSDKTLEECFGKNAKYDENRSKNKRDR